MSNELDAALDAAGIDTLFQPIVDGVTGQLHGFEALVRGPAGSRLQSPAELFSAAAAAGRSLDLERACLHTAFRRFSALQDECKLFVNVLPQTLLQWTDLPSWLDQQFRHLRLDPHTVVLELTEHGTQEHETALVTVVGALRALGCDIAIDDLGVGSSGLKTWSAIRPEYVKVDRYFVVGIEQDAVRGEILRSVVEMGRATGSHVIAEGIENREQYAVVRELGVDYMQGYLIGTPQAVPRVEVELGAVSTVPVLNAADCAEHLARPIPGLPSSTRIADAVERFRREPSWTALAVVEGTRPLGLIRRDDLLILYSKPLHPEIFGRKPVSVVMDRRAVQIDARARLEQVSRLVTGQGDTRHHEDFIITRGGGYLGLGRTMDLLRQITTQQLLTAQQSNPLTGLPGNREIHARLTQLLARGRPFIACHLDLDHFKAFNDAYGYSRGDQVLLHVAQVVSNNLRRRVDFVGHVGGDDFVCFVRSQDWPLRLMEMLQELGASLVNFHSTEHREAGGYSARGREGTPRKIPLLSMSIAAVEVDAPGGMTAETVADRLRRAKSAAKARSGNSCILMSGDRLINLLTQREPSELVPGEDTGLQVQLLLARS